MKTGHLAVFSLLSLLGSVSVTQAQGHLVLSPTQLQFTAVEGKSLPVALSFTLQNTLGSNSINWSLGDNATWLDENPMAGINQFTSITALINTTALTPGPHNAQITVVSPDVDNSPQTVAITYWEIAIGDADCNGVLTSSDIIKMVNHVFKGGPKPSCD